MKAEIVLLLLLSPYCFASLWYPPIYWHKDDCRFKSLQRMKDSNETKEVFMKVIYSTETAYGLTIICPTIHMNSWLEKSPDDDSFNENMWQVDKEGYDECEVNTKGNPRKNKLVLTCSDKWKIHDNSFFFMKTWGSEDELGPIFEPGEHYYFISTSRGEKSELKTRKVSGNDGSCKKHHMKLHIYVCQPKIEDCIYELPKCEPPPELYKEMRLINGKLPPPTKRPPLKTHSKVRTPRKTEPVIDRQIMKSTTPRGDVDGEMMPICKVEDKGTPIQLILNFVLGGVALFMAVVIIILVCGLSNKNKAFEMDRPPSALSNTHGGQIVNAEIVRYSDGHVELSPVIVSRTPPTSPNVIIPPYPTLQRMHSLRQYAPNSVPLEGTPTPQEHSPLETPLSNEVEAFAFPEQATAMDSETTSDGVDSSDSGPTTTAIVTNPRHDNELNT